MEALASRREFSALRWTASARGDPSLNAFGKEASGPALGERGQGPVAGPALPFAFHAGQLFIQALTHPATRHRNLLAFWATGSGKTLMIIAAAEEYIRRYRIASAPGRPAPSVFVVAAPAIRTLVVQELLSRPELGYISKQEVEEIQSLRASAASGSDPRVLTHLSAKLGALKQRVTNRAAGGYFRFYGYQELANALLGVTAQGAKKKLRLERLFSKRGNWTSPGAGAGDSSAMPSDSSATSSDFLQRIDDGVKAGDLYLNAPLLNEMRSSLLVVDEAQNVVNMQATNNYGVVINYILRALKGREPPRALLLSATPMTGSAAEAVDLISLLRGGPPLRRSDYFSRRPDGSLALRPGASRTLGLLAAGHVSALPDPAHAGSDDYPRVVDVGEEIAGVPYLRFTVAEPTPLQAAALSEPGAVVSTPSLVDAAFPAPRIAAKKAPAPKPAGKGKRTGRADGKTGEKAEAEDEAEDGAEDGAEDEAEEDSDPDEFGEGDGAGPGPAEPVPYATGDPTGAYLQADPQWLKSRGFEIVAGAHGSHSPVIGGPALALTKERADSGALTLPDISPKYAALVRDLHDFVRGEVVGPGGKGYAKKALIYHHRVRGTGVLFAAEVLQANGFAPASGTAGPSVLCARCGVARRDHKKGENPTPAGKALGPHEYVPARFTVVHYQLDRGAFLHEVDRFNAPSNLEGDHIKVFIGARIIGVGLTLRAVGFLGLLALPTDIPGLLQVRGRVIRRGSHAALPPEDRVVRIRTYITASVRSSGAGVFSGPPGRSSVAAESPEVTRYQKKGRDFVDIQEVERELRATAVDVLPQMMELAAGASSRTVHPLLREALGERADGDPDDGRIPPVPGLAGLPVHPVGDFRRVMGSRSRGPGGTSVGDDVPINISASGDDSGGGSARDHTYDAMGFRARDGGLVSSAVAALFRSRSVWTFGDLVSAVRAPDAVGNFAVADPDESLVAQALEDAIVSGAVQAAEGREKTFYVRTEADGRERFNASGTGPVRSGGKAANIGGYLSVGRPRPPTKISVAVGDSSNPVGRAGRAAQDRAYRLWRAAVGKRLKNSASSDPGGVALATEPAEHQFQFLKELASAGEAPDPDDPAAPLAEAYREFRILVYRKDRKYTTAGGARGVPVGYLAPDAAMVWEKNRGGWARLLRREVAEVPPTTPDDGQPPPPENDILVGFSESKRGEMRFKVRNPIQDLQSQQVADARVLARGGVCVTRSREDIEAAFSATSRELGSKPPRAGETASRASIPNLCQALLKNFLELERRERRRARPRVRWFYFFNDRQPTLSELAGRGV